MIKREKKFIDEHFASVEKREEAYRRLESGEPLAYILGEWYFFKEKYKVSPDCLIPQPDTEILVEYAIKNIKKDSTFLDMCTGSGCVAISVLASRPDLKCVATDISAPALSLAKENAEINGVADRITFCQMNIFEDVFFINPPVKSFSAFLGNPPYISEKDMKTLPGDVLKEPHIALYGGGDGLEFYRRISSIYKQILAPDGLLALEIGYDQKEGVTKIFSSGEVIRDYGGNDRVFIKYNRETL